MSPTCDTIGCLNEARYTTQQGVRACSLCCLREDGSSIPAVKDSDVGWLVQFVVVLIENDGINERVRRVLQLDSVRIKLGMAARRPHSFEKPDYTACDNCHRVACPTCHAQIDQRCHPISANREGLHHVHEARRLACGRP